LFCYTCIVSRYIQITWNNTFTSVDLCSTPASVRVPLDFVIPIRIALYDSFGNEILIGNYGLCGAKGVAANDPQNCINATLGTVSTLGSTDFEPLNPASLIPLDKKTLLVNTSSVYFASYANAFPTPTLSINFYFPRTKITNSTYFQIKPVSQIRCFPDIINSFECIKSMSQMHKYFQSHMVTADKHAALQSQFKTSSRQLARFSASYDLGIFTNYTSPSSSVASPAIETSLGMDYFVVSKNEFFLNLGYNFSQYWSMNLRPDFLEDIRIQFSYPFCSNTENSTFLFSSAAAAASIPTSSQRLQQVLLMTWLSSVTFNTPVEGQAPRFYYFCHSRDSIISEYLGVDTGRTLCCNLDAIGTCGIPPNVSDINKALLGLQITIAIVGALYSVFVLYTVFEWRQWEAEGKILKYEIPFLKFLLKNEKFKHVGLILQRFVLILLGAVPLIVCWVLSVQAVARSVLLVMTSVFLGVVSAVLLLWLLVAAVWQLAKYTYVHTMYRKIDENNFEKIDKQGTIAGMVFRPFMMVTDFVYFVCTCGSVFISAFMILMFISWTILGLIIDPTKAAPYFAAFAAVMYVVIISFYFLKMLSDALVCLFVYFSTVAQQLKFMSRLRTPLMKHARLLQRTLKSLKKALQKVKISWKPITC